MEGNQYELEAEKVRVRINTVLKENGLTENSVAAGDSATQSRLNSQLSHGKRITLDTVLRVVDACQDVSGDWLLRGTGEKYKKNNLISELDTKKQLNDIVSGLGINKAEFCRRMGLCKSMSTTYFIRGTYDPVKLKSVFPELSCEWLLTGIGPMLESDRQCASHSTQDEDTEKKTNFNKNNLMADLDTKKQLNEVLSLVGNNKSEFCRRMGMGKTASTTYINRGTYDTVKLKSVFPELSCDWLLTGIGPMLEADRQCASPSAKDEVTEKKTYTLPEQTLPSVAEPIGYDTQLGVLISQIKAKDAQISSLLAQLAERDKQITDLINIITKR